MSNKSDIIDRLLAACNGKSAKIAWPHYVLHDAIKEIENLRADLLANRANCCICGRIIDTREVLDGGDAFGCSLPDGRWVCSSDCYGHALAEEAKP